mgnify:FL=1
MDYNNYPNFTEKEFACSHCGKNEMQEVAVKFCQDWREHIGQGVSINSGYRCSEHNNSVSSTGPNGPHTTGMAIDIGTNTQLQYKLIDFALHYEPKPTGIGIAKSFTHLDWLTQDVDQKYVVRPNVWKY